MKAVMIFGMVFQYHMEFLRTFMNPSPVGGLQSRVIGVHRGDVHESKVKSYNMSRPESSIRTSSRVIIIVNL